MAQNEVRDVTNSGPAPDRSYQRGNFLVNSFKAMKMIQQVKQKHKPQMRQSDKATTLLVWLCVALDLVVPVTSWPLALKVVPLFLTFASLGLYMTNRLGIMVSLSPRQAVLVWQIFLAAFWLGAVGAMIMVSAYMLALSHRTGGHLM